MKHFFDSSGICTLSRIILAAVLFNFVFFTVCVASGSDKKSLSFAVLPILDALPFHYALENGFFEEENLKIIPTPVGSALERDQLMQAGRIDGMIGENVVVASYNRDENKLKVVGIARESVKGFPLFRILSSPESGITSPAGLAAVPIAVSKNTIIEYVTDRILVKSGVNKSKLVTKSVPVIPERFQLLIHNRIKAAVIPDPLALSAVKSGAYEVINDTLFPEFSASVVIFSKNALLEKKETVKAFMKAWDKAAAKINAEPESAVDIVKKKIRVPKNISAAFIIPPFPRRKVPSKEQWDDAIEWMLDKHLIKSGVSYESSVTTEYLPQHN